MTVKDVLKREEAWEPCVYVDVVGALTVGWGFNIDPNLGGSIPDPVRMDWLQDSFHLKPLPEDVGERWLSLEIEERENDLIGLCGRVAWVQMGDARQAALISMHYQLGAGTFRLFRRMLAAVRKMDWVTAAKECLDSDAARSYASRFDRNARALLTGEWQWS